jgi:hypothetical protein
MPPGAPLLFKKTDVKRAVKCVEACGLKVAGVEIEGSKIRVLTGEPPAPLPTTGFDSWKAKRDARSP